VFFDGWLKALAGRKNHCAFTKKSPCISLLKNPEWFSSAGMSIENCRVYLPAYDNEILAQPFSHLADEKHQ